jgi:hypothetical protein
MSTDKTPFASLGALIQFRQAELNNKTNRQCALEAGMAESEWSNWKHDRSRKKGGCPTEPRRLTLEKIARGQELDFDTVAKIAGFKQRVRRGDEYAKVMDDLDSLPLSARRDVLFMIEQLARRYRNRP